MKRVSRVLDTFLDLARISSPAGRERGVAEYVAQALKDSGCAVRFDDSCATTGSDTGNLIADLPGTDGSIVVGLSAHMDCVDPCTDVVPVVENGIVRTAGDTVLGGDDKAGIAAIIEAVRRVTESDEPHAGIRVILTVSEECGLVGAKALSAEDVRTGLCLVLDAQGPVGGIVTAAPTHYVFRALFSGRAAHAGVEPERGVSAIAMAATAIADMRLGRLDEGTTANIGVIEGGTATNVVAPSCRVTGECRSLDRAQVELVREEMDSLLRAGAVAAGGAVEIEWELQYEGFRIAEGEQALQLVEAACADRGIAVRRFATGGGSDANVISALGVPALVLSTGMSDVHTTDEQLEVAQLGLLADLLVAVLRRAAV